MTQTSTDIQIQVTDHRSKCADTLIHTAVRLAGGRSGIAIDLAVLKDETGLTKPDFITALEAHVGGDHLGTELRGDRYSLMIFGRGVDTLITKMDLSR